MGANQSDPVKEAFVKSASSGTSENRRQLDNAISMTTPRWDHASPYGGRRLGDDSIRLVRIQPATNDDDPLFCGLIEVAFSSRPQFGALSYRWGTDEASDTITLNGCPFMVRRNLHDALVFLRSRHDGNALELFWIDAVCINQDDVAERNRQVRIMDQIYFRARTVLVWLGSGYAKRPSWEPEDTVGDASESTRAREMVRQVQQDKYWTRVWILQEVGRARHLQVCLWNEFHEWGYFTLLLTENGGRADAGPLKLDRCLRQGADEGSLTLKRLLEDHREAECSDPRDKVYGLLGLASDAAGFPVDYSKSLYEVWEDTMVFMNARNAFEKGFPGTVGFGTLVKGFLTDAHGDRHEIPKELKRARNDHATLDKSDSRIFFLETIPVGLIVAIGPPVETIVSSTSKAAEWRNAIQAVFRAAERLPALREYDELVSSLIDCDGSQVDAMAFGRPGDCIWRLSPNEVRPVFRGDVREVLKQQRSGARRKGAAASAKPVVYLAQQPGGRDTERKMGVAPGLAEEGDVVCCVKGSRRAVLARVVKCREWGPHEARVHVRAFGTVSTTEGMRVRSPVLGPSTWRELAHNTKQLNVSVDAATLYMLAG